MEPETFAILKSWRFWVITAVPEILFGLLWLGLAKVIGTSPLVRDIFAGSIFIAVIFAIAWALPKFALQYAGGKTKPSNIQISKKPSRLVHDNVLWEDEGTSAWGGRVIVAGPLCPKDFARLSAECHGKIINQVDDNTLVSDSEYHSRLFCPECKGKYTLSAESKYICDSRDEVRNRFEGKRRREKET